MQAIDFSPRARMLISRATVAIIFIGLFLSTPIWHRTAPLFEHLLGLAGFALLGTGMMGRLWCGSYIGGSKNVQLVTQGPFSVTRNPLYFFSFVGVMGVALTTETLTIPLLVALLFWPYYRGVIALEEHRLTQRHGEAFEAYLQRVPRFWPNPRLYSEPTSYTVSARHFRRILVEVVWFAMAAGIIEFIEELHYSGFIPTLFHLV